MLRGRDVQQLMEMKREGLRTQAISKLTGYDRKMVRKYLLKPETVPLSRNFPRRSVPDIALGLNETPRGPVGRGHLMIWYRISTVAEARRVRVAAMACLAADFLVAHGKNARVSKFGIDLPYQHNHLASDVLPRVDIGL